MRLTWSWGVSGAAERKAGGDQDVLLDQDRIAGIGNVYVQTPLVEGQDHPLRPIPSLSEEEIMGTLAGDPRGVAGSIDAGGRRSS